MKKHNPEGVVTEVLPDGLYRITMDDDKEIIGYRGGKLKQRNIFILIGDRVEVVLDPYGGKATNRIVWRTKLFNYN